MYHRYLVPVLFEPYAADLASRVDCPSGGAMLETACGTGAATRHLLSRLPAGARLTATDLAPAMVGMARETVAEDDRVAFRNADATDLPFDTESFDTVVCQFSVMLFPSVDTGLHEAARVLKPGGRFHFNVWDRLEENVLSNAVHGALAEVYPDDPPDFLEAPYSLHDLTVLVRRLQQAGFREVDISVVRKESEATSIGDLVRGLLGGSPLAGQIAERGLSAEEAGTRTMAILEERFGDGPVREPMQSFQVSATLGA